MRLYLDDDLDGNILISLLQHAGHAVVSPRVVGTRGVLDPAHLRYAADHDLVLLTANAKDFLALHVPGANGICGQCLRPPIEEAIKRLCNQFG
jgi:Domain of unknown function (DUF5615)